MGHATDRPILEEIFRKPAIPLFRRDRQQSERAVIVKELTTVGIPKENAGAFPLHRSAWISAPISLARSRSVSWHNSFKSATAGEHKNTNRHVLRVLTV